jgi:DNA-binding NtrC family response regulator
VIDTSLTLTGVEALQGRILVFDDDIDYGQTLAAVLRQAGFHVIVASHFHPALEALERDPPIDLLLADIVVPAGVNGVALSRMARMRRRSIKIIYLTGYDLPGAETEALGPILRKPVPHDLLIAEVRRALDSA